ncbi:glycosyltransferase family A protein [Mesorhizobium sp. IMUNJ 23232]|uniref:glycosyltransferase family A protein n=1 Tax=Mesorhizobium sp. IMUNJ 23232 TaxID=3376064 RepID=UPI0037953701
MSERADGGLAASLVLVCYQMQRELPRTLVSLSPPYQRGIAPSDYEIIIVDNGSVPPVDPETLAGQGLDVIVETVDNPTVSPAPAINRGLRLARAPLIGLWVDAARMASPGLVSACVEAVRLHPRPVIATFNYHLGRRLQYFSAAEEHTREAEDALLDSIGWPQNGERLFEISTLDAKGGVTGPMIESCALFMPRALWDELGGADEAFVSPGGGAVNPDMFIRACELPDVQLIRILGQGTFHQVHGGVSTSGGGGLMEAGKAMSREYFRIRGRPFSAVRTLGWLYDPASKTVQR